MLPDQRLGDVDKSLVRHFDAPVLAFNAPLSRLGDVDKILVRHFDVPKLACNAPRLACRYWCNRIGVFCNVNEKMAMNRFQWFSWRLFNAVYDMLFGRFFNGLADGYSTRMTALYVIKEQSMFNMFSTKLRLTIDVASARIRRGTTASVWVSNGPTHTRLTVPEIINFRWRQREGKRWNVKRLKINVVSLFLRRLWRWDEADTAIF